MLGLAGAGIVGGAFYEGMKHVHEILVHDKDTAKRWHTPLELLASVQTEATFVCVPTPMKKDGSCDISIVESVVATLDKYANPNQIVVIKSTVPPGTTAYFAGKYTNIHLCFNPEFLTEANPVEDFKNQDRIIIGGKPEDTQKVCEIYAKVYPYIKIVQCSSTIAEMVKYVANCFLATKVSFANEIYQICETLGIDYNMVISTAMLDTRLGKTHWSVPGPDGHFGFGGSCFPKDLNGLLSLANVLGIDAKLLKADWQKNLEVRPEKDWEQLKGRAVSNEHDV
jgi:UDPglucose 6-dehydrogenase